MQAIVFFQIRSNRKALNAIISRFTVFTPTVGYFFHYDITPISDEWFTAD